MLKKKPQHQQLIVDAGALAPLVKLLQKQKNDSKPQSLSGVLRRAADAITNLAHENACIKSRVRLVDLHISLQFEINFS